MCSRLSLAQSTFPRGAAALAGRVASGFWPRLHPPCCLGGNRVSGPRGVHGHPRRRASVAIVDSNGIALWLMSSAARGGGGGVVLGGEPSPPLLPSLPVSSGALPQVRRG